MRPAVIVFVPLLLLPLLACTDTPAEPETELLAKKGITDKPKEPGLYVVAQIDCIRNWEGWMNSLVLSGTGESYYARDGCKSYWWWDPSWQPVEPSYLLDWVDVYAWNDKTNQNCSPFAHVHRTIADLQENPLILPRPGDDCYGVPDVPTVIVYVVEID